MVLNWTGLSPRGRIRPNRDHRGCTRSHKRGQQRNDLGRTCEYPHPRSNSRQTAGRRTPRASRVRPDDSQFIPWQATIQTMRACRTLSIANLFFSHHWKHQPYQSTFVVQHLEQRWCNDTNPRFLPVTSTLPRHRLEDTTANESCHGNSSICVNPASSAAESHRDSRASM